MTTLTITLELAILSTVPSGLIGSFVGYILLGRPSQVRPIPNDRKLLLSTLAAGLTLWFFLDIMAASTFLGINQGLASIATLSLAILFSIGFFAAILVQPNPKVNRRYDPIFLGAAIIGTHGIGEGIAIGAILTNAVDPIATIGGPLSASSFVIHKALEALIVSTLMADGGRHLYKLIAAPLIITAPTAVGALAGYFVTLSATMFYALGGGATVWLLSTLLLTSGGMRSRFQWCLALLAGILIMFFAGTLHST